MFTRYPRQKTSDKPEKAFTRKRGSLTGLTPAMIVKMVAPSLTPKRCSRDESRISDGQVVTAGRGEQRRLTDGQVITAGRGEQVRGEQTADSEF